MVLPNTDGVHSAGGSPSSALHTLTVNSPNTVLQATLLSYVFASPHLTLPFFNSITVTLSLAELHLYSSWLKKSHESLKMKIWFPLLQKIRKLVCADSNDSDTCATNLNTELFFTATGVQYHAPSE